VRLIAWAPDVVVVDGLAAVVVEEGDADVVAEPLDVVDEDAVGVGEPEQAPRVPAAARAATATAMRRRVVTVGG
jgi:hypothetical protein